MKIHLPHGYELQNGLYKVEKVLGQGGFGITYKGLMVVNIEGNLGNITTKVPVAIKEFFFKDFCERNSDSHNISINSSSGKEMFNSFKQKLIKEAHILSSLNHPNIVKVLDVFEENNTAYVVMEYLEGETLEELLNQMNSLSETESLKYIEQIAQALHYIHTKNILHLDVKPSNIMLSEGKAYLIDFGVSKRYDAQTGSQTSYTPIGRSNGYAPVEQYDESGLSTFSAVADVYALGATLYRCVTGEVPIQSTQRSYIEMPAPGEINKMLSDKIESAIMKAMAIAPRNRYSDMGEFIEALKMGDILEDKTVYQNTVNSEYQNKNIADALISPKKNIPESSNKKNHLPNNVEIIQPLRTVESELKSFTEIVYDLSFEMIAIEGGTFMMGSDDGDNDEKPVHSVTVDSFYLGKVLVNQALWKAIVGSETNFWKTLMGNVPGYFKGDQLPIENVSWTDVQKFIQKLNQLTGKNYRLPTEAEWEYAAGGGSGNRTKWAGTNDEHDLEKYVWYDENSNKESHPLATKFPNTLGLYDMSGNVWEWCNDRYGRYDSNPQNNPLGPSTGSSGVLRGGSWRNSKRGCRVSHRYDCAQDGRDNNLGFRLALDSM